MEKPIKIEFNLQKVANMLKTIVNSICEEGFTWFEDVGDAQPSIIDLLEAIKTLEFAQSFQDGQTERRIHDHTGDKKQN